MEWSERAARNESLFREVNERIASAGSGFEATELKVICECSGASCAATFEIDVGDYETVREHGDRFAVLPGHVDPDIERVVEDRGEVGVVEKRGPGADVARRLDPRSRS